jgi:hypothetical protein
MSLLGDSELAVAQSVPELDCSIARSGDNLSVISREGNGENVIGVSNKASCSGTGGKLPKAESLVPGGGESIGTVGGDNLDQSQYSCPKDQNRYRAGKHTQSDTMCEWPWRDRFG